MQLDAEREKDVVCRDSLWGDDCRIQGFSSLLPMELSSFGGVFGLKVHKELSRATKSRSRELAGQS